MPCVSGRANHTLLKKDCVPGCQCCFETAYSCQPICCKNDLLQNDCQDIFALFCNFFQQHLEEYGCSDLCTLFENIAANNGLSVKDFFPGLPSEHCRVEINNQHTLDSGFVTFEETFVIENLILVSYEATSFNIGENITVAINGKQCLKCELSP